MSYAREWAGSDCVSVVKPLLEPCLKEYKSGTDSFLTCAERRVPDEALHPHFFEALDRELEARFGAHTNAQPAEAP